MTTVKVSVVIDRPPAHVWEELRDIAAHVNWMADAEAITFTSAVREGVGTTFDCVTKLGPLRVTDKMVVTEWKDGESIAVRHEGIVTGVGRFTLKRKRGDVTQFTWEERLMFPPRMGGAVGAAVAAPIFRRVWRKNLANLKAVVEGPGDPPPPPAAPHPWSPG
ncbi:MAG: SRPBCC family protein [Actinomycetota bacterium]